MNIIGLKSAILEKNFDFEKTINEILLLNNLTLENENMLIIASKIVALSQGRLIGLGNEGHEENFRKLVKKEADYISPHNEWLTLKDGIFIANAGIDKSNVPEGTCILWPDKPYEFADKLCRALKQKYNLQNFGIVICDSICSPLRRGVTGISLGYAGFIGVEDCRGKNDLYGKPLKVTTRNLADSLSSAALLVIGESDESIPFALIQNPNVKFTDTKINPNEVKISIEEDLFKGILNI